MMDMIVDRVAAEVRELLKNEGSGHDWQHIARVWDNTRDICSFEKADSFRAELAALLHDLDDWKLTGTAPEAFPVRTHRILTDYGIADDVCEDVLGIIRSIDFKGSLAGERELGLEAKVVHDADKLDAMGAIGIARCFVFNGYSGRPLFIPEIWPEDELSQARYTDLTREKNTGINHFFDKLLRLKSRMKTGRGMELAQSRHDFMLAYLRQFFAETGQKDWAAYLDDFIAQGRSDPDGDPDLDCAL